jgi:hypothetical protein
MAATTTERPREAATHPDAVTVVMGVGGAVAGNVVGLVLGGGPALGLLAAVLGSLIAQFLSWPGPRRGRRAAGVALLLALLWGVRSAFAAVLRRPRPPRPQNVPLGAFAASVVLAAAVGAAGTAVARTVADRHHTAPLPEQAATATPTPGPTASATPSKTATTTPTPAAAEATTSAPAFEFRPQALWIPSAPQTVTLSAKDPVRTGPATLDTNTNFVVAANTCAGLLPAGGTCTVSVEFAPCREFTDVQLCGGTTGPKQATLRFRRADGTQWAPAVTLSGTALAPTNVELKPQELRFDVAAPTRTVTIADPSDVPVKIQDVFIPMASGAFRISGQPCQVVPAHGSCAVTVELQAKSGQDTLRFIDSAGQQDVSLIAG